MSNLLSINIGPEHQQRPAQWAYDKAMRTCASHAADPEELRMLLMMIGAIESPPAPNQQPWPRCACGCGGPVKERGARFIRGHNMRHSVNQACECGCGKSVPHRRRRFAIGHGPYAPNGQSHPCACGCGEMVSAAHKYVNQNHRYPAGRERPAPRYCGCGCGNLVRDPRGRTSYLKGHNMIARRSA